MPWVPWVSESMTHIFKVFLNKNPPWNKAMDQSTDGMSAEGCGILASLPYSSIQGLQQCFRAELPWMKRIHCTLPKIPSLGAWMFNDCSRIFHREGRKAFYYSPIKTGMLVICDVIQLVKFEQELYILRPGRSLLRSLEESISNLPLLYRPHQVGTCHYSSALS